MKLKITWAHGVIIALALFIIFICSMVFSIEFSKNSFDLISDNYYEEEINYQQEINASKNAAQLEKKPELEINQTGISIVFPEEFNSKNTTGKLKLIRTNSQELDVNKNSLKFSPKNSIIIPASVLVKGNYILKLYWNKDKTDYLLENKVTWK